MCTYAPGNADLAYCAIPSVPRLPCTNLIYTRGFRLLLSFLTFIYFEKSNFSREFSLAGKICFEYSNLSGIFFLTRKIYISRCVPVHYALYGGGVTIAGTGICILYICIVLQRQCRHECLMAKMAV